jgi:hypothetical protein
LPLSADEFKLAIAQADRPALRRLAQEEVLHRDPFCFEANLEFYEEIKAHLASELHTTAASIHLVGSGAVGFSLAPQRFPHPFHGKSDLDFAVVSEKLFDDAWMALLQWGHPKRHKVPEQERQWFDERQQEIFWGWLDPSYLRFKSIYQPRLLRDLRSLQSRWFETFQSLGRLYPGTEVAARKVSARLYRSEAHLIQYQAEGMRRLKGRLNEKVQDTNGIQQ